MGATNSTPNYGLSQFIGTDKPAWLQDYNGDMLKIDTAINNAKVAADNAANAASAAQGDATTALGDIASLNTNVGTISNTLNTAVGNINTINSLIGNGTPTTTDQTIIGAINEINAKVSDVDGKFILSEPYKTVVWVTADGAKTEEDLLKELSLALKNWCAANLDADHSARLLAFTMADSGAFEPRIPTTLDASFGGAATFWYTYVDTANIQSWSIRLDTTTPQSRLSVTTAANGSTAIQDRLSRVPANGVLFTIILDLYTKIS